MSVFVVRASDDVRRIYPYDCIFVPTTRSDHANVALNLEIETTAETGATLHLLSVGSMTRYGTDAETDRLIDHLEENVRTTLDAPAAKVSKEASTYAR